MGSEYPFLDEDAPVKNMKIVDLSTQSESARRQAAALLVEGFAEPRGWPGMPEAVEEVRTVIDTGFAKAAIEEELLLGWIGGLPEYDGRVWELHPLVVESSIAGEESDVRWLRPSSGKRPAAAA
jgi:aminoglycoside 6'-N-acetyltransferase I